MVQNFSGGVLQEEQFSDSYHPLKFHYPNMPMQYTAIFHGCKNGNFQVKKKSIFLIFAQNIDCGYT